MKILLVTPMPPDAGAAGAIPRVLAAQLTGLRERHDVTLVTLAGPEPAELEAAEALEAADGDVMVVRRQQPSGRRLWERRWRVGRSWAGGWPWRSVWFYEPRVQSRLDALLAQRRFDLIVAEDNATAMYRFATTAPTVLTEHEVRRPKPLPWVGLVRSRSPRRVLAEIDWQHWRRYQLGAWRRFDRVHTFADRDARAIAELAPELAQRVRAVPFGIILPARADPTREERGRLLFLGNFTHPPNVDAALWLGREIMPELRARGIAAGLTIAGPDAPAAVEGLRSADVEVLGRVDRVEPLLERAAVVLAPVRIGGGMRMKVLQGMAAGRAVVTTTRGAEGMTATEDRPPLVVADDTLGIATGISSLLADDVGRRALARRARQFAATHYSAGAYAARLEASYSELVESAG